MKRSDLVLFTLFVLSLIGLILFFVVCTVFPQLRGLGNPCGQLGGKPAGINGR
jgi:hypothetical protein